MPAPKTWKTWTSGDLDRLAELRSAGKTVAECAAALGRSVPSIKCRLASERIVKPADTRNAEWAEVLSQPHTIAGAAEAQGVTTWAVKRAKGRLKARGFDVVALRRGRTAAPKAEPARGPQLTPEQRELVAAHVKLAEVLAGRFARKCPWMADAALSAAFVGLCAAALKYDPARGAFSTFASPRIAGAILDAARNELPKGFRRDKRRAPGTLSLSEPLSRDDAGRPLTGFDTLESGELPVGWELESEDAVNALSAGLQRHERRTVRTFYLRCAAVTMKHAGVLLGVTESSVSFRLKAAHAELADTKAV